MTRYALRVTQDGRFSTEQYNSSHMNTSIRRGRFWAYIVECADGTYYTGSTNNLENRLRLHNAGKGAKYVRGRGPVAVVYQQAYRSDTRALQAERALKKLTRRQKEALVKLYAKRAHDGKFQWENIVDS